MSGSFLLICLGKKKVAARSFHHAARAFERRTLEGWVNQPMDSERIRYTGMACDSTESPGIEFLTLPHLIPTRGQVAGCVCWHKRINNVRSLLGNSLARRSKRW